MTTSDLEAIAGTLVSDQVTWTGPCPYCGQRGTRRPVRSVIHCGSCPKSWTMPRYKTSHGPIRAAAGNRRAAAIGIPSDLDLYPKPKP